MSDVVENDPDDHSREYIPLPGGWEVQTKGRGSSYRLLDKKTGERHAIISGKDWRGVQEFFTRFAHEVFQASREPAAEITALRDKLASAIKERDTWDAAHTRQCQEARRQEARALAAYEAAKGGGETAAVTPLEWTPLQPGWTICTAPSVVGRYLAAVGYFVPPEGGTKLLPRSDGSGTEKPVDYRALNKTMLNAAKAAAQADYEARIRSALAPAAPPAVDLEKVVEALEGANQFLLSIGHGDGTDGARIRRLLSDIRKARE